MPITRSADPGGIAAFVDPDLLPEGAGALFAAGGRASLFASRAWYRTVVAHALPDGARPCFALWPDATTPLALFPLQRGPGGGLRSLTTPYTCLYAPLFAPAIGWSGMVAAGTALARFCRGAGEVRLDALAADDPPLVALLQGARRAGLAVRQFDHFGNWYEPVGGLSWAAYLERRPGALRETVRRKLGRAERDPAIAIEIVTGTGDIAPAIAAFEAVYARSWKEPEPFPDFNAALIRAVAPSGALRLAILRAAGAPVAAQLWVVEHGRATVLKLAHDEAFKPLSPGTVLTGAVLRRLLDDERVEEIDFGRGDDPYKQQWTSRRRQRIGVLLLDPRHPRGLAGLGRDALGRARHRARAMIARTG